MAQYTFILPGDGTDFGHWRSLAKWLWAQRIAPPAVVWHTEDAQQRSPDLFAPTPQVTHPEDLPAQSAGQAASPALTVPRWFVAQAEQCLLNCAPERFALLYRLLWRLQSEPALKHDPLDPDRVQMQLWTKAVRREVHKMHAFVRFRPVALADDLRDGQGPLYVAWFEPEHHIVQAVAPFFVNRFANMRWAILTPQCCLRWWPLAPDVPALEAFGVSPAYALKPLRGRPGVLSWGPGAQASEAPPSDAGEALWMTYYAHIFNPARLKVAAMRKEMPRRYWKNLPEAQLISPLVQAAQARSAAMLAQAATTPLRKIPRKSTSN